MRRAWITLAVAALVAATLPPPVAADDALRPWLEVWYPENRVQVVDWAPGNGVTLTIDGDFDTANGVLYQQAVGRGTEDRIYIELAGIFDIEPGQVVTVSDGQTTIFHQVTNLVVAGWDVDADTVFGSAPPDSDVQMHASNDEGGSFVWRSATADSSGNWVFDFSEPGTGPGEQDLLDIKSGTMGAATQPGLFPDDGGQTHFAFVVARVLPAGTSITTPSHGTATSGMPTVYMSDPLTVRTTGCSNGTATATLTGLEAPGYEQSIAMGEAPIGSGAYTGTFDPVSTYHGLASVSIAITGCDPATTITFDIYIDPSGVVLDTLGRPVVGATVTLFNSGDPSGPFGVVPDGSSIMSEGNRANPDLTGANGLFGWDVVAGYYKVRAEKSGCTAPGGGAAFVETEVLTIPPPVTDLALVLDCPDNGTVGTQLSFRVQPSNERAGSAIAPSVTVRVLDASDALVRTDNSTVITLSISANPGGGTLSGTVVRTADDGVATFPGLSIDKVGHGYRLRADAPSLTGATSNRFDISSGPAVSLRVAGYPSPTSASVSHPFTVTALDAFGNTATGYSGTVRFTSSDGAAALPGSYHFNAYDDGVETFVATFRTASPPDQAIVVTDVSRPWINGSQSGIVVTLPTVHHLTISPASSTMTAGGTRSYSVKAYDSPSHALGMVNAALSISPDGSCGITSCTATTTGVHTVTAVYAGKTTTATLNLVAGPAADIVFGQQPTNARRSQSISPAVTVRVVDAYGNLATPGSYLVAIALGSNSGGTLSGTIFRFTSGGAATFPNLSINRTGSGYRLVARTVFLGTTTSNAFNITP